MLLVHIFQVKLNFNIWRRKMNMILTNFHHIAKWNIIFYKNVNAIKLLIISFLQVYNWMNYEKFYNNFQVFTM